MGALVPQGAGRSKRQNAGFIPAGRGGWAFFQEGGFCLLEGGYSAAERNRAGSDA